MNRFWRALALAGAGCLAAETAQAEPVKIAIIETLSGGQAAVGKMFLTAINYGLIKLNGDKVWPDGIKVLEYDNQGGPSEAADKLKAAINDGAHIIVQGASSAIGGQITDDVRKHNLRNPGKEIMYFNVGAEAMEFTGSRCHFYHFRWNGNAEIRLRALLTAMRDAKALGSKVYVIGQNYSWGHDVQRLVKEYAKFGGYTVVGDVIHDVNKIQDFAPYVAKIKETGPDTVITGNWSSDLLLLMKAAGDSGLKVRFATYWMDQPGNVANAGATAIGHFNVSSFYPEANGDATARFADDFKAKMGQYPVFIQGHTVHGIWGLGEALKKLKAGRRQAQRQAARLRHGDRQLQHQHGAGRHAQGGSPGVAPAGGGHRLEGGQVQGGRHRYGLQAAPPHIRARGGEPGAANLQDGAPGRLRPPPSPGAHTGAPGQPAEGAPALPVHHLAERLAWNSWSSRC